MEEVRLHRFAGTFEDIPYDTYVQSPVGLVGKSNGKTHLIFHLSFAEKNSINFYTPKYLCSVKYNDLDSAIRLCMRGAYMAKAGMKSAFRHLLIKPQDRRWLIMKARNPWENNKTYYFVEKCEAFGSSISCSHFQGVSNGIEFIFRSRKGSKATNYLMTYFS